MSRKNPFVMPILKWVGGKRQLLDSINPLIPECSTYYEPVSYTHLELSKFINAYKSASSRLIKKEYPEIRQKLWKEMFWSQSFCLLSAGGAPIEVIRQYIETQGENKSEHRVPFSDLPE